MNDREEWRERVRDICVGGMTRWWWRLAWIQFFFSTGYLTKSKEPSLPHYSPITGERTGGFLPFPRGFISTKWNKNGLYIGFALGSSVSLPMMIVRVSTLPKPYIYLSNIQAASKDSGCGLFMYRIYEGYPINLWECSLYGYCYIFFLPCLYNKTHIQSIYSLIRRKLKPG